MRHRRLAAVILIAELGAVAVAVSEPIDDAPRVVTIPRLAGGFTIDGRLDEPAWGLAAEVLLPFEVEPGDNTPAPVATVCRLGYDAEHLVFACEAHDPVPAAIRAAYAVRDGAENQDDVGLVIDTHGDARRAYLFSITALGVQGDSRFDQQTSTWDSTWDAIWSAAGRRTDGGFDDEAAVPFRSIRFAPEPPGGWRFWFFRGRPRSEFAVYNSAPLDRADLCRLCQVDRLAGVSGLEPGVDLELTPTLTTLRADRAESPGAALARGDADAEAGLDLRWSPRPEVAFNATWNPDFSQVEADVAQLDVNTRFALSFPEKRPFFLEGGELFETPVRAFFSRTVVDPAWGVKASGRLSSYELGAMVTRDESPQLVLPGPFGSRSAPLAAESTTAVARLRGALGSGGSLGLLATGRTAGEYRNHLVAIDAFARPRPSLSLRAQFLASETRDSAAVARALDRPEESRGRAVFVDARRETRDWLAGASWRSIDAGFRADAGFVPQVDVRGGEAWLTRQVWGDGAAKWTQLGVFASIRHDETTAGELLEEELSGEFWIDGPLQSALWVQPHRARQRFAGRTFDLDFVQLGGRIRPNGHLGLRLGLTLGDAIDFTTTSATRQQRWTPSVELRLGQRTELSLAHDRQRLLASGREQLAADLTEVRLRFHLSPRASTRLVVQEQRTRRGTGAAAPPLRTRERFAELLAAYELAPQRALYVGLSEGREGSNELDPRRASLRVAARTYFVKVGWAWRP